MRYYIIAGEASGDLHASNLMKELSEKDKEAVFRVWGGDRMEQAGGDLVKHYRDLAFMGFLEVVKNLSTILDNIKFCKADILTFQPDVLILVDYPGFNLRIAAWAKTKGIKVFYYISPQIWAWNTKRVHKIKKIVDRMFVILPFEKAFYKDYECDVDFVGHPLLDEIKNRTASTSFRSDNGLDDRPIVALLPGSRLQEIKRMLAVMLETIHQFPNYQFVIAGAPSIEETTYQEILGNQAVKLVSNKTYDLLENSTAALVTSGTATLETALFNVPQVVCYSGNPVSYQIAKRLVKVNYISLVNLISDKEVVKELIQEEFNPENLKTELALLLDDNKRTELLMAYEALHAKLGGEGASERTAKRMIGYMDKKQ